MSQKIVFKFTFLDDKQAIICSDSKCLFFSQNRLNRPWVTKRLKLLVNVDEDDYEKRPIKATTEPHRVNWTFRVRLHYNSSSDFVFICLLRVKKSLR